MICQLNIDRTNQDGYNTPQIIKGVIMPIEKTCVNCGGKFEVPKCRKETARFCSRLCSDQGRKPTTNVFKICPVCGNQFVTKKAWIKKGAGKYCSVPCADDAKNKLLPLAEIVKSYVGGKSCMQIGKEFGVAHSVIWRRLRRVGVKMRTTEEGIALAYKGLRGPNSPLWKGGRQLKRSRTRHKKCWLI